MSDDHFNAEYIVGPRYRIKDITSGVGGTCKLEKERGMGGDSEFGQWQEPIELPRPVAGAIQRAFWDNGAGKGWVAQCELCSEHCKPYKKKNESSLWRWARNHRCGRTAR